MTNNFISPKHKDEKHVIHSKSDNIEIMTNDKVDEVIDKLFELLLTQYQLGLETLMGGSDLIFCITSVKNSLRRRRPYADISD